MKGDETMQGNELLLKQLQFYKKNDMPIHITRTDGRFYNGKIFEVKGDLLILDDNKLGEMPIYFIEIKVLEKFTPK